MEEVVKSCSGFHLHSIQKLATKELHSQQGKDENEKNKKNQQSDDGGDRVDQRLDQVTHRRPVSKKQNNLRNSEIIQDLLLCNFETSQETDTSHNRETHRRNQFILDQDVLQDRAQNDKKVKSVEQ